MGEFWLVSIPGDKTPQQAFEKLNDVVHNQHNLSVNNKFNIPDLKVGTLDQLVGLSDDLGKLDGFVEQVTKKIALYLGEVLEDQRDKLAENLLANGAELTTYLTRFQWDMAKYPVKQSLRNISEIIAKQVGQIDSELKAKSAAYNNLKGNLQNLEKKQTGSLLTRNLGDLVRKEHFVLDSEYLVTLLVVVPKNNVADWTAKYERLTQMVVPRSSQTVTSDNDHALVTVTLFHKVVDEFRTKARENRFIVRDFSYNEESITASKSEINKLLTDKKKQYSLLVRWLKINFSEAFTAWIHVKALRVFVESVLRYGLPVNFQAVIMQPNRRNARRLREVLNNMYSHLDSGASQPMTDAVDIPGLGFSSNEYYPYVFYKLNVDVSDLVSTKVV